MLLTQPVTFVLALIVLAANAEIFRISVCNHTTWDFYRPIRNDRYWIESPGYDGHTPYEPNVVCDRFRVYVRERDLCCRLVTLNFDMNGKDALYVFLGGSMQPYFLYNQPNVKAAVLTLTPEVEYAFQFTTDAQNEGTGFRLEIECTKCADDKLEGQTMCDKDGDTQITYTIDTPFAYREERYIQNYNFRNFTYDDSQKGYSHNRKCSLILEIHDGICCNMVRVWYGVWYSGHDDHLYMYKGTGDVTTADDWSKVPRTWSWYKERILPYSVQDDDVKLYANKKYKLLFETGATVYNGFYSSGFQLRLMCIWCDAAKNKVPTDGLHSTAASTSMARRPTRIVACVAEAGPGAMETMLMWMIGVLILMILLVLLVFAYCCVTKNHQLKEANELAKAARSVAASKDIKTADLFGNTDINTHDQQTTAPITAEGNTLHLA